MKNRRDGKRIKNMSGSGILMPYILPKRGDSEVYINYKLDVTNLIKYVEEKKSKNPEEKLTYFHVFVTAIGKIIYNRPYLNRFVVNKAYYERNNVSISFVAKSEFNDKSEELMSTIIIDEDDTLDTVRKKVLQKVTKVRSKSNNSTNDAIDLIGKFPKFIRDIALKIFFWMDKHDLLPLSMCEDNIYYSTVLVSNLGSIDCGAIYHHLTEFGTNSIVITIGDIHKEKIINKDDSEDIKDIVEFGICLDERIADGFYFIKSIKLLEDIFNNPEKLEENANAKIKTDN